MGPKRTPSLAARYADEFNAAFAPIGQAKERFRLVRELADKAGREPTTIKTSVVIPRVCIGIDEADVRHRVNVLGPPIGEIPDQGMAGTPEYVAERLSDWVRAGTQRIYIHVLEVEDLEHVKLLGERVKPLLAS